MGSGRIVIVRVLIHPRTSGTGVGMAEQPGRAEDQVADDHVSDDELAELYRFPDSPGQAWVRAIFITSADGSAQGPDGASASLSGPGDRRIFELQRSLCDVVLVGAGTARVERYRPVQPAEVKGALRHRLGLAPTPAIAVVSGSMALDGGLLEPAPAETLVVTTLGAQGAGASEHLDSRRVIRTGATHVDLAAAVEELVQRGLRRVLCEGGPTLLSHLVAAGRLDDLCLTIAPHLVGGDGRRLMQGSHLDRPPGLTIEHLVEDDGSLFARYLVDAD